jgi:hypothetical protein
MHTVRTILGAIIGALVNLALCRMIPFSPDLSDWGGLAYPRSYLVPLLIFALISYVSGWIAAGFSARTGRLTGMLASLIAAVINVGWNMHAPLLEPLLHHPAYPIFSDHALLALAVLLVGGHLGGLRVERTRKPVAPSS